MDFPIAKIVMLKGEKGEVGQPTDEQLAPAIAKYIHDNPAAVIDTELIERTVISYMDTHEVGEVTNDEIDSVLS